jgi:uncharacterized protein (DUF2235 family)
MSKRLIVCFDGTWNTPDETRPEDEQVETNVRRIYESILPRSADGQRQVAQYYPGVGTKWYERIRGGVFGYGLSENVLQGYEFLSTHYQEGDEIFLFGFSRGAYTARSLVGLIRNCGLLWNADRALIEQAYELYTKRDASADTPEAQAFRRQHSRTVRIRCLGVWDTVGALGIPLKAFKILNDARYGFHDVELSSIVEHAYHAVALDEHRKEYNVALWQPSTQPRQSMEQRWFIGAHSDVGGGYEDRRLSDITLQWMQQKATACGLAVDARKIPVVTEDYYHGPITDSYSAFLKGTLKALKALKGEGRYYRAVCQTVYGNESIDRSALLRFIKDSSYQPQNRGFVEHVQSHFPVLMRGDALDEAA